MDVIKFDKVWFRYDGNWILEDVNLNIKEKEFICIVGPNGGGKSTFLKLILGILAPQKGTITVYDKSPQSMRSIVGYSPQSLNFDSCFPITVLDVVLMGAQGVGKAARSSKPQQKQEALYLLEELEMDEFINRSFSSLSGGQRQRVLIARALMGHPKILVFDEPTANMDVEVSARLIELMKKLNQRMTILMVSHDYRFVEEAISQVICVNKNVAVHNTEVLTLDRIHETFHGPIRIVQHDHCQVEDECSHHSHLYPHSHQHSSDASDIPDTLVTDGGHKDDK